MVNIAKWGSAIFFDPRLSNGLKEVVEVMLQKWCRIVTFNRHYHRENTMTGVLLKYKILHHL